MRDIKINNEMVMESLNKFKTFVLTKYQEGNLQKDLPLNSKDHTRDR